jgi:N-acyl-D-aspartate/D-glutamate deacylase
MQVSQPVKTTIFKNGVVIDGRGIPAFRADVAVSGGRISEIGVLEVSSVYETIDISGMVVAPGFIDIHTHSDLTLISNPLAQSKIRQGVTTEVVGNCGFGSAPLPKGVDVQALRAAVAYIDLDSSVDWDWDTVDGYLSYMANLKTSVNVASLVGHIPIHTAVVGYGKTVATRRQIDEMNELLREGLNSGAYGFSTGLNYSPISYASREELLGFAGVVAETNSFFAWHMRNYGDELMASVNEVISIARETGARTQISHLVAVGERNWGAVQRALEEIDRANSQGADISVDVYPYLAGNCPLSQFLPAWAQEGGDQAMKDRLGDPNVRKRIIDEWCDPLVSWNEIQISSVINGREQLVGQTIADIAVGEGKSGDESALNLMAEMGNSLGIIAFGRSEQDLLSVFNHSRALIGSDGQSLDPFGPTGSGSPHPRSYGCYPRLLSSYVGSSGLSLERAIQMSTSAVARKLQFSDRGEIVAGARADLVVFDPTHVRDRSTFNDPHQFPLGIPHVMVNGELAIRDGEHTGVRSGKVLRRNI